MADQLKEKLGVFLNNLTGIPKKHQAEIDEVKSLLNQDDCHIETPDKSFEEASDEVSLFFINMEKRMPTVVKHNKRKFDEFIEENLISEELEATKKPSPHK